MNWSIIDAGYGHVEEVYRNPAYFLARFGRMWVHTNEPAHEMLEMLMPNLLNIEQECSDVILCFRIESGSFSICLPQIRFKMFTSAHSLHNGLLDRYLEINTVMRAFLSNASTAARLCPLRSLLPRQSIPVFQLDRHCNRVCAKSTTCKVCPSIRRACHPCSVGVAD